MCLTLCIAGKLSPLFVSAADSPKGRPEGCALHGETDSRVLSHC